MKLDNERVAFTQGNIYIFDFINKKYRYYQTVNDLGIKHTINCNFGDYLFDRYFERAEE